MWGWRRGIPFHALLQDAPDKHLGVHMTVLGDFHAKIIHVHEEMNRHQHYIAWTKRWLSPLVAE